MCQKLIQVFRLREREEAIDLTVRTQLWNSKMQRRPTPVLLHEGQLQTTAMGTGSLHVPA